MKKQKIVGSPEAWEEGKLGQDDAFVRPASKELEQQVDEVLCLKAISIRLPSELIDDFKFIAAHHGLSYQPLMREALKRFADAEYKLIAIELANEKSAAKKEASLAADKQDIAPVHS